MVNFSLLNLLKHFDSWSFNFINIQLFLTRIFAYLSQKFRFSSQSLNFKSAIFN